MTDMKESCIIKHSKNSIQIYYVATDLRTARLKTKPLSCICSKIRQCLTCHQGLPSCHLWQMTHLCLHEPDSCTSPPPPGPAVAELQQMDNFTELTHRLWTNKTKEESLGVCQQDTVKQPHHHQ